MLHVVGTLFTYFFVIWFVFLTIYPVYHRKGITPRSNTRLLHRVLDYFYLCVVYVIYVTQTAILTPGQPRYVLCTLYQVPFRKPDVQY